MKISEKDRKVFEFIKRRIEEGYAPTVREICAEFGFKSTSTAHRSIHALTESGLLEKADKKNRALRIAGKGYISVPLVGTVTAGVPITAIEDITDYISFRPDKSYSGDLFALKVRGESMIKAGILNDDIVIVEKTPTAENGEIVVALCEGQDATVKRFFKEDGQYRLQPENDTMDPIILDKVDILGKVVGLIRYFK